MSERRSIRIIQSTIDIAQWREPMPSVSEARPGQCPCCDAPSRPVGGRLGIWGHGGRSRQSRGPRAPGAPSEVVAILVRRYRCIRCGAILVVVPRGIARCKHYAATAIAFALGLFGVDRLSQRQVREAVGAWPVVSEQTRSTWVSLRRWIAQIQEGALWPSLPRAAASSSTRQIAERAAMALSALPPPSTVAPRLSHLAFDGGAHMA